jgi:hypothetical protein
MKKNVLLIIFVVGIFSTLLADYITVTSPNGGESWQTGTYHSITWNDNISENVKIQLIKNGQWHSTITSSTYSDGSYNWNISSSIQADNDYKIEIQSVSNSSVIDWSNYNFTITAPNYYITVTSPNGGESWQAGTSHNITWNDNISENVEINLIKNGQFHSTIASSTSSDGSRNWNIPSSITPDNDYKIEIQSVSNSSIVDWSNYNFTITAPDYIEVTSPNGGEYWQVGTSHNITWNDNISENVKIKLIKNEQEQLIITNSTESDDYYDWGIPSSITPDNDYKIEIQSVSNSLIEDWSDNNFTITDPDNYITIIHPNGGEIFHFGEPLEIIWSDNISENVEINLIKNGQFHSTITSSTSSDGYYNFTAGFLYGNDYQIEIQSVSDSLIVDWSDNYFTITGPLPPDFIYRNGNDFMLNNEVFNFVGTNCYYLMEIQARDQYHQEKVNEVLDLAESTNIEVIRTWGFNDDPISSEALQTSPGVYNEFVWAALDSVIYKAQQRNMKLILPLVNYWDSYGGMNQYVEWYNDDYDPNYDPVNQQYFYSEPVIKEWFKQHINVMLTRTNHITGIMYKDDPTIMAWELANEPREPQGNLDLLTDWIVEMTQYIKSIDSNHMVGTGSEGNYWGNDSINYFIEINDISIIDFSTLHLYVEPDHLNLSSIQEVEDFLSLRINTSHSDLNKPFILEEFGFDRNFLDIYGNDRLDYYQAIYDQINIDSGNGSNFWVLFPDGFQGWDDGNGVFSNDTDILNIISNAAGIDIPQNVHISYQGNEIVIFWDVVSGANSYKIYSSNNPYNGFEEDLTGNYNGTSWSTSVTNEKRFYYVIAVK